MNDTLAQSSNRLAHCGEVTLQTRSGDVFVIRTARPLDFPAFKLFLRGLSKEDLRFRFLSAMREVPNATVEALLHSDHRRTEHFLAFAPGESEIAASAVLATDDAGTTAEVAICTAPKFKHHGLSWALLEYAMGWAAERGVRTIESIESSDHGEAIALERELGFSAMPVSGTPGLVRLSKRLPATRPATVASF